MNEQPTSTTTASPSADYSGRTLAFYHPTSKGNGCALRIEPRINQRPEDRYNCFFLEMAAQKTTARREAGQATPGSFDWQQKITVKLSFTDVCELLAVLEGAAEKAGQGRNGLYHATPGGNTLISLQRDPQRPGCYLALSRKRNGSGEAQRLGIALSVAEMIGLRCLLQHGLFFITFPNALKPRRRPRMDQEVAA